MAKSNAVSCVDQPFGCPPLWSVCSGVFLFSCWRVFFLLNWSSSLHMTGRSPLPDVCLAQSFLRFIACLSILTVSLLVNRGFSFYYSPIHVGFSPHGSLFSESCWRYAFVVYPVLLHFLMWLLQGDQTSQFERKTTLNIHWKDWCWSWNSSTLATWCEEPTHWKRPWCWRRLRARGKGDDRGWDDWMESLTQWTWVRTSSGRWWRTRKPRVLQSMGSQKSQTWFSNLTTT